MKKKITLSIALLFVLGAALPVYAMNGKDHGSMTTSHTELAELGEQTVDGVKATAQLGDVREAMAAAGQPMTHHLQILFTDPASGETIESGSAAVKVTTPAGEEQPARSLHGMEGHFGVDLTLSAAGNYKFVVGTKLADGKKRQYEFSADIMK
ncbi:MAG: hypothetical protein P1P81_07205 [Desulfobulbales bacterium]|nr:hypothetical protein [Desulfobulbales bacterium]